MQSSTEESIPLVVASWVGKAPLQELRTMLDRAMNTWEPQDWPAWLDPLSSRVDKELSS